MKILKCKQQVLQELAVFSLNEEKAQSMLNGTVRKAFKTDR